MRCDQCDSGSSRQMRYPITNTPKGLHTPITLSVSPNLLPQKRTHVPLPGVEFQPGSGTYLTLTHAHTDKWVIVCEHDESVSGSAFVLNTNGVQIQILATVLTVAV